MKLCRLCISVTLLLWMGVAFAATRQPVRNIAQFTTGPEPEIFADIVPYPGGGALLAGFNSSFTAGQMDAYASRIDADGELVWEAVVGDTLSEEFYTITPTDDGGALAVGTSNSFGELAFDFYLHRFDADGNTLWQRSLGGTTFDVATGVFPHPMGGWTLTGFRSVPDDARASFRVARVDETAENVIWNYEYGGPEHDFLLCAAPDSEGGLILAGSTHSFDAENRDGYIVRIDSEGTQLWQQLVGGPWPDYFHDIIRAQDGTFVLTGVTHQNPDSEESDLYVVRINAQGTVLGELVVGGDSWDEGWGLVQLEDRGFFVVGNSFDPAAGVMNGYGLRLDEEFNILWAQEYGDNDGYQEFRKVMVWGEDTAMAVGYTSSTDMGDADYYTRLINTGTQEVSPEPGRPVKEFMLAPASPNPFNSITQLSVQLPSAGTLEVAVYNLLGQRVALLTRAPYAAGVHRFSWNADRQASGSYVIEARHGGHVQRQRVLLVK